MIRWLILLGVVSISVATAHLAVNRTDSALEINGGFMKPAYALEVKPAVIPPIDAAAPAVFETASFGLG